MARVFVADGRAFPDPDPAVSVEEVRKQLAEFLPELTNADVREEKRGEDTVYVFTRRIGTKGRGGKRRGRVPLGIANVVETIRRVPEKHLRVFELAAELFDSGGELDIDAAAERAPEVNLAVAEAEAYARATERAVTALRRLPAR
jgi:PRTRC genetic system protein C